MPYAVTAMPLLIADAAAIALRCCTVSSFFRYAATPLLPSSLITLPFLPAYCFAMLRQA